MCGFQYQLTLGEMSELTVIIPSYNMRNGAIKAVESVLCNKLELEIIVVDDGSVPALQLPHNLAELANVTLLRHDKNRGASAARNTGIFAAKSDWISFLDSDDVLVENSLDDRFGLAKKHFESGDFELTLYGSGWLQLVADQDGYVTRTPLDASMPEEFASGCWYCPGSCIIGRRDLFMHHPFDEDLRRLEDLDLGIRFGLSGGSLIVFDMAGAKIERGNMTDSVEVVRSAQYMLTKYNDLARSNSTVWCALCAYLNLEIAAINFRENRRIRSAYHLIKSFYYKPRLKLHLSPGWKISRHNLLSQAD